MAWHKRFQPEKPFFSKLVELFSSFVFAAVSVDDDDILEAAADVCLCCSASTRKASTSIL